MFLSCHVHVSEWIHTLNVKKRLARSRRKIWWNLAIFNFQILILFFANQCTLLNNSSALSNNLAKVTNRQLDTVNFSTDDISKIIRSFIVNNLDPNKVHGHDMLSNRMIKLYGNSICKPPSIIFNDFLKERRFPSDWKKAHVLPVHKKGEKQCLKNYRPISLLPICSKIFERLIYNELFTIFTVSQASILGALLFLVYINDLSNGVSSNCKLFADDASLF